MARSYDDLVIEGRNFRTNLPESFANSRSILVELSDASGPSDGGAYWEGYRVIACKQSRS